MNFKVLVLSIAALSAGASTQVFAEDQQPFKRVMTQGLNHLGLTVKNLKRSSEFFIETLGWRKAGGYPDYPSIFVTDGSIFLTLWKTQNEAKIVEFDRKNNVGLHHLALSVASLEDLNQLHETFKSIKDVVIEFAPEPNGNSTTIHMMIREPSGNRLEFAYNPPRK
ncbi:VOC family protein [Parashewanella tropica]|uniref:VOC family protein n=1 Tax=Parashewanella tropica TaxID=2547970 RepID=UPI0010593D6E|nr:VOC family protein [Parashewanella tropica]